ncbi:calcium channel subunit cch1 [Zalerion maritima]|uniref:Calcium-channel protein CCH1 n=1 Tax=Zalerion maritima TaxID=339359 RepID=A0AAD5WX39_9PEZI|nr:calcium channel subunit cch1 [Zalerion maritima]
MSGSQPPNDNYYNNPFHSSSEPSSDQYHNEPYQQDPSTYWNQPATSAAPGGPGAPNRPAVQQTLALSTNTPYHDDDDDGGSPIDPAALQFALPPQIDQHGPPPPLASSSPSRSPQQSYSPSSDPQSRAAPPAHIQMPTSSAAPAPPQALSPPGLGISTSTSTPGSTSLPPQPSLNRRPVAAPMSSTPSLTPDTPPSGGYGSSPSPYYEESPNHEYMDSDRAPLTSGAQPIAGALSTPGVGDSQSRNSFQTVSDLGPDNGNTNTNSRYLDPRMTRDLERGQSQSRHRSYGNSLMPGDGGRLSRSPSAAGALLRAGSMVRAMSQRVVMISGEGEAIGQQNRRNRSRSPSVDGRLSQMQSQSPRTSMPMDTGYPSQLFQGPSEKMPSAAFGYPEPPVPRRPMPNPLCGKSLGIFGPENPIRKRLCDILVFPFTEPLIALLIMLQVILLAIDAAPNIFRLENVPKPWGSGIDWALFGLFIVFTLELVVRIIVSGFILNAAEHSTIDRKRGVRAAVADQYNAIFQPERQKSIKGQNPKQFGPSPLARSFTIMQGQSLPETVEEQQRFQLARRAFMRHSFNRLDFVAIISFWVAFFLGVTGLEQKHHVNIFKMLSCLRILRLLALTNGTAIILRSLKKSAPLLVRVSFLIGFFWLVFAIVGVQSFKSSLRRQCVWVDPLQPEDINAAFTNEFQFCGGHRNNDTGATEPWVYGNPPGTLFDLTNGTTNGKGFICPRGSYCLQQDNPYNGTVNFDDIVHSLELVFVIMSANTFSDLMYYTTNSDYLTTALFFGAGIMIMMLWLTNLLIAVITSSFQVIREESRGSAFTGEEDMAPSTHHDERLHRASRLQRAYLKSVWFWVLIIALDMCTQALRSARMPKSRELLIDKTETVVTILLAVEIIIRFAADWKGFHRNYRNLVDLVLAIITCVIIIPPIRSSGPPYEWMTFFQIVRAYRLVLAVPMTKKLILLVLGNAVGIANLMLFVFLITFIMAIFAVQLFRGEIPEYDTSGDPNRIAFNSLFNAFLGMYQVLSSENWTEILYTVTANADSKHTSWIGAIFLIGWFILAFFILINMFIAVIQENFDVSEDEKRIEQVKSFLRKRDLGKQSGNLALSSIFMFGKNRRAKDPMDYGPAMMEMLLKDAVFRDFLNDNIDPLQDTSGTDSPSGNVGGAVRPGPWSSLWGRVVSLFSSKDPNPFYSNTQLGEASDGMDARQMARQAVSANAARRRAQREYLSRHPRYNNSLFLFKPKNPARRLCQKLVGPGRGNERFDGVQPNKIAWHTFSAFIYAVIVAMVIIACVTTPRYQREYSQEHGDPTLFGTWFVLTDTVFAILFTLEAAIKVVADGFFWTPNAYYRSSWGIIDGVVLITLWINVVTILGDTTVSRAVGAFKALRALRLLNVSDSARDTMHSLIVGVWKILSAAFVSISLLIPFAIYGVNLFMDRMVSCNDDSGAVVSLYECYGEYASTPYSENWEVLAPRVAANDYFSFDDFGSSLFTLFQIVSQEGWTDVSFAAQAITGRKLQPEFQNVQGNAVFFVIFNLLATVFVLTLFISVFMRNYTEQTGVAFLTAEQRSWLELRKMLRQISPSKSSYDDRENKFKKWCHKRAIEKRGKWYMGITTILVFHLILLLLEFDSEPKWWTDVREYIFLGFIMMYVANVNIRIVGLGWSRFRRSSWDIYSLLVVTGAFATSILLRTNPDHETYIQLHKLFLVAIVGLLIPRNDALDQLFKTAAASLTTIANLLATWLVFFLVFAIALTQSFSLTRFAENGDNNINFRTVPNALIVLFRMSCGEGWNQLMEDFASLEPPVCVESADFFESDCGSLSWARFLFVTWNILSMYIFVSLFVSLIYESFSYVYQRHSGLAAVDRDEIRRFKEAWRSVDPAGTGFISKEAFPRLLGELSGVFEMRIYNHDDSVRQILDDIQQDESPSARHMSLATTNACTGIDVEKLNKRIAEIDIVRVRERRRRFNIFFEEVMVAADPDKGISFTTVLMILAHYNIINDSKSLRLDEFLKRRARLQRVEEEVRRRVVKGFFQTLYWKRQFQKHLELKGSARMTGVPQLGVPDILVEDGEELRAEDNRSTGLLSPHAATDQGHKREHHRSWSSGVDISGLDAHYQQHPLSFPRGGQMEARHRPSPSSFSFELREGDGGYGSAAAGHVVSPEIGSTPTAGQGPGYSSGGQGQSYFGAGPSTTPLGHRDSTRPESGSFSPSQVGSMLDQTVWMESIRRSATLRRPDRSSYR